MRTRASAAALLAAALLWAAIGAAEVAEDAVVKVPRLNVRSGPGTGYPVVTQFEQGSKLHVLERSGDWYRIALPREGHGWVFRDLVDLQPGAGAAPGGGSLFDTLKKGFVSSRQQEVTAAAGSRGLGEEGGSSSMRADEAAVRRMEGRTVSPEQVRRFIEDGGLKPEKKP